MDSKDLKKYQDTKYFMVKKPDKTMGESAALKKYREENIPVMIQERGKLTQYNGSHYITIGDPLGYGVAGSAVMVDVLEPIDEKEGKDIYDKKMGQNLEKINTFIETLSIPKRLAYKSANPEKVASKMKLATNNNFVTLISSTNNIEIPPVPGTGTEYINAVCCALTKCTQNVFVQIPVIWAKYFGYNEKIIKDYLELLKGCGFDYVYHGRGEYIGNKLTLSYTAPLSNANGVWLLHKDDFYKIYVGGTPRSIHTYMRFILIRYLYNNQYWNIPMTALLVKNALAEKYELTDLQCLMIAHTKEPYYAYYNWVQNTGIRVVDPFQDFKEVLKKCNGDAGTALNSAFSYINFSDATVQDSKLGMSSKKLLAFYKLWESNNYEEVYQFLTENSPSFTKEKPKRRTKKDEQDK